MAKLIALASASGVRPSPRITVTLASSGSSPRAAWKRRALAAAFPEVPEYRVDLGRTLLLAGDSGAVRLIRSTRD